jgi:hypothetical protein
MRKYLMLLALTGFLILSQDVGKATNVSPTVKTLLICDDVSNFVEAVKSFDGVVIVVSDRFSEPMYENIMKAYSPPDFIVPAKLEAAINLKVEYAPYKERRRFKPKFHAEHLFNPVKRC